MTINSTISSIGRELYRSDNFVSLTLKLIEYSAIQLIGRASPIEVISLESTREKIKLSKKFIYRNFGPSSIFNPIQIEILIPIGLVLEHSNESIIFINPLLIQLSGYYGNQVLTFDYKTLAIGHKNLSQIDSFDKNISIHSHNEEFASVTEKNNAISLEFNQLPNWFKKASNEHLILFNCSDTLDISSEHRCMKVITNISNFKASNTQITINASFLIEPQKLGKPFFFYTFSSTNN